MTPSTRPRHTIAAVALRTGLSQDLLRTWEKRHALVRPGRSESGRRLYSDQDVEFLLLVKGGLERGLRIGDLVPLDREALVRLTAPSAAAADPAADTAVLASRRPAGESQAAADPDPARRLASCLGRVDGCDAAGLWRELNRASVDLSLPALLDSLLVPLLRDVGEAWTEGRVRIGQEHLVTVAVRSLLEGLLRRRQAAPGAPRLLAGTPSGQRHELGALMAALLAGEAGWDAVYPGPDLPAEELAQLARRLGAQALALSLTPPVDATLALELARLRELLPPEITLLLGGGAVPLTPTGPGIRRLDSLAQLPIVLAALRRPVSPA
ncbi:MAG: MerR family transcriptional regulator [Candidatus Delongbacteria bacterium]